MGVGEGDFHRTRLTHSIEAGQIGEGILAFLKRRYRTTSEIVECLPSQDLVIAACYAHDLGHPPFGHGGEKALHSKMVDAGGFEGNGQTLRILTRLEKFSQLHGINPTRRTILAILKYPIPYSTFDIVERRKKPKKCYFDTEAEIVSWALADPFTPAERNLFTTELGADGKPRHRSLDASLMECADDIAYAVHDLEDIVARHLVRKADVMTALEMFLSSDDRRSWASENDLTLDTFEQALFAAGSPERKSLIGRLVNLFVTSVELRQESGFSHPLLRYRVVLPSLAGKLLNVLKALTLDLVIQRAEVQQLERRGQRIVEKLFEELSSDPKQLIPKEAWGSLDQSDTEERRVCDYIAGMTDRYAERIYQRLFIPGFGSSRDEL